MRKQKLNLKSITLAAGIALGLAASAQAQTVTNPPTASTDASGNGSTGYGLLGQNYTGLDFSYIRHEQSRPEVEHDYGMVFNQSLFSGLDFNAGYDYLTGSYSTPLRGTHDWRQEATAGLTGYLPSLGWGKPFVDAQAGWAWQEFGHHYRDEFTYSPGAGVEFQVLPLLAVSPYAQFEDYRHAGDEMNYGVKATYRFTHQWSATLDPQIDQHRNIVYEVGLNLHY